MTVAGSVPKHGSPCLGWPPLIKFHSLRRKAKPTRNNSGSWLKQRFLLDFNKKNPETTNPTKKTTWSSIKVTNPVAAARRWWFVLYLFVLFSLSFRGSLVFRTSPRPCCWKPRRGHYVRFILCSFKLFMTAHSLNWGVASPWVIEKF